MAVQTWSDEQMRSDQQELTPRVKRDQVKSGRRSPLLLMSAWVILLPLAVLSIPAAFRWGKRFAGDANVLAAAAAAFAVTLAFSSTLYWFTRRYVNRTRRVT